MSFVKGISLIYLFIICCLPMVANDLSQDNILVKVHLAAGLQENDPDSALQLGYEILRESKEINYVEGVGYASVRVGSILHLKGEIDSSIYYLRRAFEIRKEIGNEVGAASIKRYLSYIFKETGQIDSAFSSSYESIRILEEINDSLSLVGSYLALAKLLSEYEEEEQAKLYYDKSFNAAISINDSASIAYCYEGYGRYFFNKKLFEEALSNFMNAAKIQDELNNSIELSVTYNNIASCYSELKEYTLAISFYKDVLELYQYLRFKGNIALVNRNLGASFFYLNEYDSSINYYTKAKIQVSELGDIKELSIIHYGLAKAYSRKGNYKKAYQYHLEYSVLKDSLLNEEKIFSIAEMQTKYDTEKKEQQIILLDEQNKTKEAQRNLLIVAAALLLLGILALGFLYVQRRRIAQKNELIAEQKIEGILDEQEIKTYNAMLEGQEDERMRIATDLHDRLGSMLSTVKLLFSALDDKVDKSNNENKQQYEKANHLIDEACAEVRRVSHNLGTGMVANFGLSKALEELCESINQSGKIDCSLQSHGVEDGSLQLNIEVGIYRMVQEVVNNALKYSKATSLSVQLNKHENSISIMVEDNGIGFNLEEVKTKGGMGLGNLEMRATKLGGSVHIDTKKGRGTTTIIELPMSMNS